MKIIISEKQSEYINELTKNPNLFIKPNNWRKIKAFSYNSNPVVLYYNNDNKEFYLNTIGTKEVRLLPDSEYNDVGSSLKPMSSNLLFKMKRKLDGFENNDTSQTPIYSKSISNNVTKVKSLKQNSKPKNIVKNNTPTVKVNPAEQKWVGIWEKFLVKYVGFNGGDKDNLTGDIDKAVFNFINNNKHLYQRNKNINIPNLKRLMTDGKKGSVHDSFLPPFYYKTNTLPIFFYQKSDKIMNIQKKLGVKQTGIFLNQTEKAIIDRIKLKNTQGYNLKYNRKGGINQEIYDAIMSADEKNKIDTPELIKRKGEF